MKNKLEKQFLFFDLDGTITDSAEGILNAFEYALDHYNIKVENRSDLRKILGPPLHFSFMNFFGFKQEEVDDVIKVYREYFSTKGIFENNVYDGIEDVLKTLKEAGKTLVIATSKPAHFTEIILNHFKLYDYFTFVSGAEMDGSRSKKEDIIKYALDNMKITNLEDVVMIGDREHDIKGANINGLQSIGVLYGYGNEKEFTDNGADYIVSKPEELLEILL